MKKPHPQTRASRRTEEVQAVFDAEYRAFQYRFVEFFIEHLSDISRAFRGDLQAMVVLALVGQVQLRAARDAALAGQDPMSVPPDRLTLTASSIADVTGIPRQTVRRKLILLEQKGWVQRNEAGAYRLAHREGTAAARLDLDALDRRALARVARLFRDLEEIVAAHKAEAASPERAQDEQPPPSPA